MILSVIIAVFGLSALAPLVWAWFDLKRLQTRRCYRSEYVYYRRLFELYQKRAEWAEVYAGQLEAEMRIPFSNRMHADSWRVAHRNFQPFILRDDE